MTTPSDEAPEPDEIAAPHAVDGEVVDPESVGAEPLDLGVEPVDLGVVNVEPEGSAGTAPRTKRGPLTRRSQVLVGLLCALLGFALVTQVRSTARAPALSGASQSDLVQILDDLGAREQRLQQELADLRQTRDQLSAGSDAEARAQLERQLQTLGILAGTEPVAGPGVVLTIKDPSGQVDSALLLDALEELRDAGAEAMQIGPVRMGASTAFSDTRSGVAVDGQVLRSPYVFTVVGPPDTLAQAMDIPGGVIDSVAAVPGASARVSKAAALRIDVLRPAAAPSYARPSGGTGG